MSEQTRNPKLEAARAASIHPYRRIADVAAQNDLTVRLAELSETRAEITASRQLAWQRQFEHLMICGWRDADDGAGVCLQHDRLEDGTGPVHYHLACEIQGRWEHLHDEAKRRIDAETAKRLAEQPKPSGEDG